MKWNKGLVFFPKWKVSFFHRWCLSKKVVETAPVVLFVFSALPLCYCCYSCCFLQKQTKNLTADGLCLPDGGGVVCGDQPRAPPAEDRVLEPPRLRRRRVRPRRRQAGAVGAGRPRDQEAVVTLGAVAVGAVVAALFVLGKGIKIFKHFKVKKLCFYSISIVS